MSILLEALFDAVAGGLFDGRRQRRFDFDRFFGKAFSVVIAFWVVITGVYACTAVLARDDTAPWLPLVIAFVGTAVCGALLDKRPAVCLGGGLAACFGPCVGMVSGLFVLIVDLIFLW